MTSLVQASSGDAADGAGRASLRSHSGCRHTPLDGAHLALVAQSINSRSCEQTAVDFLQQFPAPLLARAGGGRRDSSSSTLRPRCAGRPAAPPAGDGRLADLVPGHGRQQFS